MLNGEENENGIKINRSNQQKNRLHVHTLFFSNQQKKQICTCSTLFVFLCRCFAYLQRCFVVLRACLHEGGGPQVGEVTCGGLLHLTCKRDHIKMRECMDRRVTPPKRVTSPTWGPPPPCKQALKRQTSQLHIIFMEELSYVLTKGFFPTHFHLVPSMSHFLTAAMKLSCFLPTKFVSLALSLLST